ncbi:hypothetical protein IWX49DRAFT_570597 [Phyllosticta citricarpa]
MCRRGFLRWLFRSSKWRRWGWGARCGCGCACGRGWRCCGGRGGLRSRLALLRSAGRGDSGAADRGDVAVPLSLQCRFCFCPAMSWDCWCCVRSSIRGLLTLRPFHLHHHHYRCRCRGHTRIRVRTSSRSRTRTGHRHRHHALESAAFEASRGRYH